MCYPTLCATCGRTTWRGCGKHVADVRAGVPDDQWCPGHADANNDSWLRRILGR